MKRPLAVVCTVLLGLLASAGPARADPPSLPDSPVATKTDSAEVRGASGTCTVPVELDAIACSLKDTAADKRSVFLEYKDSSGRHYRFNNDDNFNSERSFVNDSLWKSADTSTMQWRVCVNKRWVQTDRCSDWVNYAVDANALSFELDCRAGADTCHQLHSLSKDDGWEVTRGCALSVAGAVVGMEKVSLNEFGKWLFKKVPGAGWMATGVEVGVVVHGCK
jgi:hypothetical protein